jgi:hypothetical protein
MEQLNKPEIYLAGGALVTSIGSSIYLNSQINELRTELEKTSEHLKATVIKVDDAKTHKDFINKIAGAIKQLNEVMFKHDKVFNEVQTWMKSRDKLILNQNTVIEEILQILKADGHEVNSNMNSVLRELYNGSNVDQEYHNHQNLNNNSHNNRYHNFDYDNNNNNNNRNYDNDYHNQRVNNKNNSYNDGLYNNNNNNTVIKDEFDQPEFDYDNYRKKSNKRSNYNPRSNGNDSFKGNNAFDDDDDINAEMNAVNRHRRNLQ